MKQIPDEQFTAAYNNIPEDVAEIFYSSDVQDVLMEIYAYYKVDEDTAEKITTIISYTMLGLLPLRVFMDELNDETDLETKTVESITEEVSQALFAPVKDTLLGMQPDAERMYEMREGVSLKETDIGEYEAWRPEALVGALAWEKDEERRTVIRNLLAKNHPEHLQRYLEGLSTEQREKFAQSLKMSQRLYIGSATPVFALRPEMSDNTEKIVANTSDEIITLWTPTTLKNEGVIKALISHKRINQNIAQNIAANPDKIIAIKDVIQPMVKKGGEETSSALKELLSQPLIAVACVESIFSTEQVEKALKNIPSSVTETIKSDSFSAKLKTIVNRQNASSSLFNIAASTGQIILGLVPVKRFIQALKEEAGLSEDVAKNVAHDIRSEILAPVAQELAAIQEEAERNWQNAHSATDDEQSETPSGKSETNSKSEIQNPKPKSSGGGANEPGSTDADKKPGGGTANPPTQKDESVAREVFPAPDVKKDKFEKGPEGEMPEEKKDERF